MAIVAAPFGARVTGSASVKGSFNGGDFKHIPILSTYATNIFTGDFVKLAVTGNVELDTGTATLTPVGIFVGYWSRSLPPCAHPWSSTRPHIPRSIKPSKTETQPSP